MSRSLTTGLLALLLCTCGLIGCNVEDFDSAVGPTLDDINRIISDTDLTVQERRTKLGELGLSPTTINALLRAERTGNQFGGDLRTAFEKVTGGRLTELTPDEVQIYGDGATNADVGLTINFTDTEALDVQTFFRTFGIFTTEQLESFLDQGGEPTGSVNADTYRGLFVDLDPNVLLPLLP